MCAGSQLSSRTGGCVPSTATSPAADCPPPQSLPRRENASGRETIAAAPTARSAEAATITPMPACAFEASRVPRRRNEEMRRRSVFCFVFRRDERLCRATDRFREIREPTPNIKKMGLVTDPRPKKTSCRLPRKSHYGKANAGGGIARGDRRGDAETRRFPRERRVSRAAKNPSGSIARFSRSRVRASRARTHPRDAKPMRHFSFPWSLPTPGSAEADARCRPSWRARTRGRATRAAPQARSRDDRTGLLVRRRACDGRSGPQGRSDAVSSRAIAKYRSVHRERSTSPFAFFGENARSRFRERARYFLQAVTQPTACGKVQ